MAKIDEEKDIDSVVKFANALTRLPKGHGLILESECAYIYRIKEDVEAFKTKMDSEIAKHKRYIHYHEGLNCLMFLDVETRNKLQITFDGTKMVIYPFKNCIPKTIKDVLRYIRKECSLEYDSMWQITNEQVRK